MNIVELVKRHVDLIKIGSKRWRGHCPFHKDNKTPNFTVFEETNTYYCFACEAFGDVYSWVDKMEDADFFIKYPDMVKESNNELNDWEEANSKLALSISDILRQHKDTTERKKWLRIVGEVFSDLRGEINAQQREEIYRRFVKRGL